MFKKRLRIVLTILFFRIIVLMLVFINFRIGSNKLSMLFIMKIFMEIKRIRYFLIKFILAMVVFLFLNYNRYVYYRVGLTINYGYVFIYAFRIVLLLWLVWSINNILRMLRHFFTFRNWRVVKGFYSSVGINWSFNSSYDVSYSFSN